MTYFDLSKPNVV